MIVVADTSPLNYLILIDEIHLLPFLFDNAVLPQAVFRELQHANVDPKVSLWANNLPRWAQVRTVGSSASGPLLQLDLGEREAIQLALEMNIHTVLMDETEGRVQATNLHLEVRGTLGILERGAQMGKTDFRKALEKLQQTNFRLSPSIRDAFLRRNT